MIERREGSFPSSNGVDNVFYRAFIPETPSAIVQIAHGMAEHSGRYDEFAMFLAGRGFAVYAGDHLGHGRTALSDADTGFFAENCGWEDLVADMESLRLIACTDLPGLKTALFGHSMGSYLARTHQFTYPGAFDAVVLSGTGDTSPLLASAGRFIGRLQRLFRGERFRSRLLDRMSFGAFSKGFSPRRTDFDWLSRDEARVDQYISDPRCGFVFTLSGFDDLLGGISRAHRLSNIKKGRASVPVLFISGERDPVGDMGRGVARVADRFRRAGYSEVSVELWPDCRHELLNEQNRSEVFDFIAKWLETALRNR